MVGYSPLSFCEKIFCMAISREDGTENERIAAVLNSKNKNKTLKIYENNKPVAYTYKQISEMRYASIYALAINKQWNIRQEIISSDSPDIIFINQADENDRVAIEIYEGFNFEKRDNRDIVDVASEVEKLYRKKGKKKYQINSRLLVANRVESMYNGYNVSEYVRCLEKHTWNFSCIILGLFKKCEQCFTFFYGYPKEMGCKQIDFNLKKDTKYWY